VSEEAQAILAKGHLGAPPGALPAIDDVQGWKAHVAATEAFVRSMEGPHAPEFAGTIEERDVGPCPVYVATPEGVEAQDRRVLFDIHGGSWVLGRGDLCKKTAILMANALRARTWAVDYRMPPDYPFPSPLDDCVVAYRELLAEHQPSEIVVGGTSSGGNVAAALILRIRDEQLPLPAAVVFNTGAFDLTRSGDSWRTNDGLDNVISGPADPYFALYAGGHDPREPYLSPLFGQLTGFPPTLLLSGTRDRLLSDSVRMHRALRAVGVQAELHVWEAAGHAGFLGLAPEDMEREEEMRRFSDAHWDTGLKRALHESLARTR
jgi:acetyl esterase/lipase